jgi:hypothetical protein
MWDERECGDKRNSAADLLSSWIIVAAIVSGVAVWSGLPLLMRDTSAPNVASREVPGEIPLVLNIFAPADDNRQR